MPQWGKINSQKTFLFQKCYFWILDTFVYLGVFEKKSFSNVLPCYQIQIIKSFIWVNSTESIWLKKYWCFTKKTSYFFTHLFITSFSFCKLGKAFVVFMKWATFTSLNLRMIQKELFYTCLYPRFHDIYFGKFIVQ